MHGLTQEHIQGGILYTGPRNSANDIPLLAIHGLGGHHKNFSLLHQTLLRNELAVWPCYVDLPGYGTSLGEDSGLSNCNLFLSAVYTRLASMSGKKIILLHVSASPWFTIQHHKHVSIHTDFALAVNPVRIPTTRPAILKRVSRGSTVDVRTDFLASFFSKEQIQKMDRSNLGKPQISIRTIRDLWDLQDRCPFRGWNTIHLFLSSHDPLASLRLLPAPPASIDLHRVKSTTHGICLETSINITRQLSKLL